uniref:Vacuolar protein sorting-associated protein 18 homolog n=1 Tax=Panagrellus redivivus TaxID=6233 RepID=A0A7E4VYA6_PANRE
MARIYTDPLFEHVKVPYTPKHTIVCLKVQNDSMFIALHNPQNKQWVLRYVRVPTGKTTDVPLPITDKNTVTAVFVDPKGIHCVVTTSFGESYYVNSKFLKAVLLKKLKGHVITSIGWNPQYNKETETGFILVGTSTGSVFETSLNNAGTVMYFKLLTDSINSSKHKNLPVSSIVLKVVTVDESDRWIAFICLPGQLHIFKTSMNTDDALTQQSGTFFGTFVEPANAILNGMFAGVEPIRHRYVNQEPNSSSSFVISDSKPGQTAARYAWVNEDGISVGVVDLSQVDSVENYDLIKETGSIPHEFRDGVVNYPLAVQMTRFHIFVLYRDRVNAYSAYNYRSYFEERLTSEKPISMSRDPSSQMVWTFNDSKIWKYKPLNEGQYVWKVFLDSGDFVKARALTKLMSDKTPFKAVVCREAEHQFEQGNYLKAANLFFEADESFDAVVLRFMQDQTPKKRAGLKSYLALRLDSESPDNEVRITLLVLWIMELRLCELAELREDKKTTSTDSETLDDDAIILRAELHSFMDAPVVLPCLKANLDAAYRLVISHMDFESHIYLARLVHDYDTLIRVLILQSRYKDAIHTIEEHGRPNFFYKFAPDLLKNEPQMFLKALRDNSKILDPTRFLPTFYKCIDQPQSAEVAFQYFSHVVSGGNQTSPAIHAFLILLYAECKPAKLLDHLKAFGTDRSQIPYDAGNALRLCMRKELKECCIFLYSLEGMHESAVKLALEISTQLAIECAKKIGDETLTDLSMLDPIYEGGTTLEEVKKHVWLMIARHMLAAKVDIVDVLNLIKESNYVLSVDSLLPSFPEFTSIEAIQGPLCAALKEKSEKIQSLQAKVKEASSVVDALKRDIENRKKSGRVIKVTDKCPRCDEAILLRPFYAFNCWHYIHTDCLEAAMDSLFTESEKLQYDYLKKEYTKLSKQHSIEEHPALEAKIKLIKQKMGKLLGVSCPLCGMRVIELIDKPFFNDEEYANEMKKWQI